MGDACHAARPHIPVKSGLAPARVRVILAENGGGSVDDLRFDHELDCAGLLCPLPVLKARKRLIALAPGSVLRVLATDRMAEIDLPHFCTEAGHEYLGMMPEGGATAHFLRRGPAP